MVRPVDGSVDHAIILNLLQCVSEQRGIVEDDALLCHKEISLQQVHRKNEHKALSEESVKMIETASKISYWEWLKNLFTAAILFSMGGALLAGSGGGAVTAMNAASGSVAGVSQTLLNLALGISTLSKANLDSIAQQHQILIIARKKALEQGKHSLLVHQQLASQQDDRRVSLSTLQATILRRARDAARFD